MNKEQKIWLGIGIVAIVVIVLAYSFAGINTTREDEVIKIGVLLPLSGDFAAFGESFKRGLEDSNLDNVKLIYEDTKCKSIDAINGFRKLSDVDGVRYIIGPACGSPQEAIAPLVKDEEILVLIPIAASEKLFEESGRKIYQMQYSLEDESKFIAEIIFADGHESAVVIGFPNSFSETHVNGFKNNFKGEVHEIRFSDYSTDINSELTKISQINPDAIFITDIGFFLSNGIDRLMQFNIDATVYSQYATQYEPIREFVEGVTYSFPGDIHLNEGAEYALSKQAAELLGNYIKECENDHNCVKGKLDNSGLFNEKGVSTRLIILKRIENGVGVLVE